MRHYQFAILIIIILLSGCSSQNTITVPVLLTGNGIQNSSSLEPGYIPWGFYNLEISRDGSYADVIPIRSTDDVRWGYHMNVVKFLEESPCTDCLEITDIHVLGNGDVSVDISLRNPFMDRRYTGFDVRGIIMFPASQYFPDNNYRAMLDLEPAPEDNLRARIAHHEYGDAELMNPDGWTTIWSAEIWGIGASWPVLDIPDDLPIFKYYSGKFASGENLSTLSTFIRYHSTDERHMFETGHTVTQTYIIRPPESGPIEAAYSVYAHWYPADNIPVIDPAVDFPARANSPLPYEFYITQDAPFVPDDYNAPGAPVKVHWHIKMWDIGIDYWSGSVSRFVSGGSSGSGFVPHPSGEPDDYLFSADYIHEFVNSPDCTPGSWPALCCFHVRTPLDPYDHWDIGTDWYIMDFEYGEW